ncbi:MAG: DUF3541 domain-containing protein [Candidatus Moraniibacteriota bacterium]
MKISYISKTSTWNDDQILKEAEKMGIDLEKIDVKNLNNQEIFKSLGDIILWRSSSLEPRSGRAIFLSLLIKSGKKVINRSIADFPGVVFKQFQQKYLKESTKKINTIPTFTFNSVEELRKAINEGLLKIPFIKKPNLGSKGFGVELVSDIEDLNKFDNEEEIKKNIFQNFIKNDGDYRVLVIGGRPIGAIKRIGKEGSFVNNVSMGGQAVAVEDEKLKSELFQIASQVAAVFNLGFCGVDIIRDSDSNELFFLELNTVPQWEGFQKSTGINVARELLMYCKEFSNEEGKKTPELVNDCYKKHFNKLAGKKFHFASRMFLWTKDNKYLKELDKLKEENFGNSDEEFRKIVERILKNKESYKKRVYNNKKVRKESIDKFPYLGAYNEILFRNMMSKNIFGKDLRFIIKDFVKDEDLIEMRKMLIENKNDFVKLSTFASNYLFFLEEYFEGEKETKVNIKDIFNLIKENILEEKITDIEEIRNKVYLLTHLIIGASGFYAKSIKEDREVFLEILKIAEKIVKKNYFNLTLDVKLELIVCGRMLKVDVEIEKMIKEEANQSLSDINNFLVDKFNSGKKVSPISFLGSEHRNVLYLMINS